MYALPVAHFSSRPATGRQPMCRAAPRHVQCVNQSSLSVADSLAAGEQAPRAPVRSLHEVHDGATLVGVRVEHSQAVDEQPFEERRAARFERHRAERVEQRRNGVAIRNPVEALIRVEQRRVRGFKVVRGASARAPCGAESRARSRDMRSRPTQREIADVARIGRREAPSSSSDQSSSVRNSSRGRRSGCGTRRRTAARPTRGTRVPGANRPPAPAGSARRRARPPRTTWRRTSGSACRARSAGVIVSKRAADMLGVAVKREMCGYLPRSGARRHGSAAGPPWRAGPPMGAGSLKVAPGRLLRPCSSVGSMRLRDGT